MDKGPHLSIVPHIVSFLQKGTAGYNVFSHPPYRSVLVYWSWSVLEMLDKPLSPCSCQSCQQGTSLLTRFRLHGDFSPMLATQNLWHL